MPMNLGYILAIGNITLSLGAYIGYAVARDWRHSLYWLSAAVLTSTVTF